YHFRHTRLRLRRPPKAHFGKPRPGRSNTALAGLGRWPQRAHSLGCARQHAQNLTPSASARRPGCLPVRSAVTANSLLARRRTLEFPLLLRLRLIQLPIRRQLELTAGDRFGTDRRGLDRPIDERYSLTSLGRRGRARVRFSRRGCLLGEEPAHQLRAEGAGRRSGDRAGDATPGGLTCRLSG